MKKKWIAVLVMLMLIMTGAILSACSDKEPAEESDGIYVDGGQDIKIHDSIGD